jgi:hypothetical protein
MWLEKLTQGMLRVLTPLGPRYVNPSLFQRLYLLWLFRNFETLPVKVLSAGQQKRVDQICRQHGFVSALMTDATILGTLEQRPPVEVQTRPSEGISDVVTPFATDLQRRS